MRCRLLLWCAGAALILGLVGCSGYVKRGSALYADGRYIGFQSFANDIGGVPDPNATYDIFIWDREHYEG